MADEGKIFIDEDWKAQVQREKEEAAARQNAAGDDEQPPDEGEPDAQGAEPEAGFAGLVQSLATQCMFALGLIAPPDAKQVMVDLGQAKYIIDTLLMLREKTKGNLSAEEEGVLGEAIGELQRVYVVRAQQAQEAALRESGIDLNNIKAE